MRCAELRRVLLAGALLCVLCVGALSACTGPGLEPPGDEPAQGAQPPAGPSVDAGKGSPSFDPMTPSEQPEPGSENQGSGPGDDDAGAESDADGGAPSP